MTTPQKSPADIHKIISELREEYVTTPRDEQFRSYLDRLLKRGPDGHLFPTPVEFTASHDTHGVAVSCKPGGGKSTLVRRNLARHPAFQDAAPGTRPWIEVQVPSLATLKSLGFAILAATGYTMALESNPRWNAWDVVRHRLRALRTCVLWIDEVHHLMRTPKETVLMLDTIKSLMQGEGSVIVILTGIETLWQVIATDDQVSRRFLKIRLPDMTVSNDGEALMYQLEEFCEVAGLEPPREDDLVARLIHGSRGCFGLCIESMINTIETALLADARRLEIQHFAETWAMREGCEIGKNVFLSPRWSQLDLSAPVRA
jgi:hypothetical protein